jgi:RNA polymerase sigma-70 factor (ECF subfamily)
MVERPDEERPMLNAAIQPAADESHGELGRIFRENATRVLAAAYRVTGNTQDAEDVLQTVFLRLIKSGGGGGHLGADPGGYLRRAAVNAGVDVLRSRRGVQQTPFEKIAAVLPDEGRPSPDRVQGSHELRAEIRRALVTLSPRSAEIFALRYFEGYDNHEIAKMLGTSRSTVAVILHRTRNHLREAIRQYLGE